MKRIIAMQILVLMLWALVPGCATRQAGGQPPVVALAHVSPAQQAEALELFLLATLQERNGDVAAAVDEMARAVAADPSSVFLHTALGELYFRIGQLVPEDAARAQQFQKAVAKASDALLIEPQDESALRLLADSYRGLEDTYNYAKALNRLAAARPDDLETTIEVAGRLLELDQLTNALSILERAKQQWPAEPQILYLLGVTHAQMGRYAEAEQELLQLLEKVPNNAEALAKLGLLYEKMGRAVDAVAQYERVLALGAARHDVRMNYADLLYRAGRSDDAAMQYQLLERIPVYREWAQTMLGQIQLQQNQPQRALDIFLQIARDNPENIDVLFRIAFAHEALGEWDKAAALYEQVLALRPSAWQALEFLVQTHFERGQIDQGLRIIEDHAQRHPGNADLQIVQGRLLNQAERHGDAVRVAQKALRSAPRNEELLFILAAALERMGETDRSIKYFKRVIDLNPKNARALNYYGYMLADGNMKLQDAKQAIERAVAIAPDVPEYWDSLGWVHFRLGNFPDAVNSLNRSIELGGEDPVIFEHLGDVFRAMGSMEQANDAYEKALALDKDNVQLQKKLGIQSAN